MTDEQWLWLFINQAIDTDEELEGMCDDCRSEVTSTNRCSRCGKIISVREGHSGSDVETGINDNFDIDRYEAMKNHKMPVKDEISQVVEPEPVDTDDTVDIDLIKQMLDGE